MDKGEMPEQGSSGVTEVIYRRPEVHQNSSLLRKVVRVAQQPGYPIAELTGNPNDQGTDWSLLGPKINGATEFSVGLYKMIPNQIHPPHYHPIGPEFYYIVSGSCLLRVDDEEIEVGAETAIYLPEGTVHAVRTRSGESVTILYGFDERADADVTTIWLE